MSLKRLEELAKAATPGPWEWINPTDDSEWSGSGYASLRTVEVYGEDKTEVRNGLHYTSFALPKFVCEAEEIGRVEDANYIAEANPANIQALLALVHEMANDLQCVSGAFHSEALTKYKEMMKLPSHVASTTSRCTSPRSERSTLRATTTRRTSTPTKYRRWRSNSRTPSFVSSTTQGK